MKIQSKVVKYGENVNTDLIIPAKYLNTSNPDELAKHCMSGLDSRFVEKTKTHRIMVAGANFGCGSSREHAPVSIKHAGILCVIADSFARIFARNAINIGLPIVELKGASRWLGGGDKAEVLLDRGVVRNLTTGREFSFSPFPPFLRGIIKSGGLINYIRKNAKRKKNI
jgi:3-isopropylmalate/(R)-2-methylmalate dehydratase small subunit